MLLISFYSCNEINEIKNNIDNFSSQIQDELLFLGTMAEEYGGSWNKQLDGDAYTIEIINSERLNNKDSIEYHAIYISRFLKDSLETNHNYLRLEIIDESKIAIFTSTDSYTYIEDMRLAFHFKNISIEEYIPIKNAILAALMYFSEKEDDAKEYLQAITNKNNSYYIMAKAAEAHFNFKNSIRDSLLTEAYYMDSTNARTNQYIGSSYFMIDSFDQAKKYFDISKTINPETDVHIDLYRMNLYLGMEDSALVNITQMSEYFPDQLGYKIERYNLLNQMGLDSTACIQMKEIKILYPEVEFEDSLNNKCTTI